jgi:hypothetical protein
MSSYIDLEHRARLRQSELLAEAAAERLVSQVRGPRRPLRAAVARAIYALATRLDSSVVPSQSVQREPVPAN